MTNAQLGRYELVEVLGRGAMGTVYKAHDPLIERDVALKTIDLKSLTKDERKDYITRFYREAKAAGVLKSSNIVSIYDLGETDDTAFMAMELLEGRELQEFVSSGKPLRIEESLNIALQIAEGLQDAHRNGIIHLDIKPSNIMILGNGRIKIADFGIARFGQVSQTLHGVILGTPYYMSPEQFVGKRLDFRSDIYSLGVTLYQMLTGTLPFPSGDLNQIMKQKLNEDPPSPSTINPEVNEVLDKIVLRCLNRNPQDRYKNTSELVAALRTQIDNLSLSKLGFLNSSAGSNVLLANLKKLVIPDSVPEKLIIASGSLFVAMIFIIDNLTDSSVQVQLLYMFPLLLIGIHTRQAKPAVAMLLLVLFLESEHLFLDEQLGIFTKLFTVSFVFPSNIITVFLARLARRSYLELINKVYIDPLTGLNNRTSFEYSIDMEIQKQLSNGGVFSVVFLSVNRNDTQADPSFIKHFNEFMIGVANLIKSSALQLDSTSRIGSTEFSILKPNTDLAACEEFCEALSSRLSIIKTGTESDFSIMMGYTTFDSPPSSVLEVLYKAENALMGKHSCIV